MEVQLHYNHVARGNTRRIVSDYLCLALFKSASRLHIFRLNSLLLLLAAARYRVLKGAEGALLRPHANTMPPENH